MRIRKSKNGSINMTAQSELDSLLLLEMLESMGDVPLEERASVKKRQDLIERGIIKEAKV